MRLLRRLMQHNVSIQIQPRRKRIGLYVVNQQIIIKTPRKLRKSYVEALLIRNQKFLSKALSQAYPIYKYISGELFYLRGNIYQLKVILNGCNEVQLKDDFLQVTQTEISSQLSHQLILQFYSKQANTWLEHKYQQWQQLTQLQPSGLSVKNYKSRFGSCDRQGHISLNWRLILAPDWVIDYVIIHELCHLIEFNHSPKFWQLVCKYHPDYLKAKKWLKEHTALLMHTIIWPAGKREV